MSEATRLTWLSSAEIVALASQDQDTLATRIIGELGDRSQTLACGESLTGGLLADALVRVPGASAVFLGSAVTYSTDMKHSMLGVDSFLLRKHGAVHEDVASAMAQGVLNVFGSDIALATTGVAGPTPQDGQAVGTVFVGVARILPEPNIEVYGLEIDHQVRQELGACSQFTGAYSSVSEREAIRRVTVLAALSRV